MHDIKYKVIKLTTYEVSADYRTVFNSKFHCSNYYTAVLMYKW